VSDFRDAVRALRANPLVTVVAILSLALGIGANTAMFSVVDALVLRGLPVRHADRLTMLFEDTGPTTYWTGPIWKAIERRPSLADGAFAFSGWRLNLARGGAVDQADGLYASGGMFSVMGVDAVLGRTFTVADDVPGGGPDGPVAVISWDFWHRRHGGDPGVVGQRLTLDGYAVTIVGVTGPSFFGPEVGRRFDVAIPLNLESAIRGAQSALDARTSYWLQVMFRLAPGQTAAQATAAFRAEQSVIADETRPVGRPPEVLARYLSRPLTIRPGATSYGIRDQYARPMLALLGIAALTLLVACGNIANLMLGRAAARRHELSVRSALGASGARLGRQLLTEGALLSVAGAGLGLFVAVAGSRFLVGQIAAVPNRVFNQVFLDVGLDWRLLLFTGAVAVSVTLLFGVAPAWRAARVAPIEAMKEHGRGTTGGRRSGLAGMLVSVQVALSLVLLIGAGLFVRTFTTLVSRDRGLDTSNAVVAELGAAGTGTDSASRWAMYQQLMEAVSAIPEVTAVGMSSVLPLSGSNSTRPMVIPGHEDLPESERRIWVNSISPGWFAAVGTPLLAGRDFDQRDRRGAPRTVVVNAAFARRYFGSASAVGRIISEVPTPTANLDPIEIVGVVADAVYRSLREPVPSTMYWPMAQQMRPPVTPFLIARSSQARSASLAERLTAAATGVNARLTTAVRPYDEVLSGALTQERVVARLAAFFGALALVLAGLGLYGVTAHAVNRRRPELGIRMALGTTPAGVVRLVMGRVGRLVGVGLVAGALVSWWTYPFLRELLFGLGPRDPVTLAGAAVLLLLVSGAAGWFPARAAARIDPVTVLRDG
jgi:predicted permease